MSAKNAHVARYARGATLGEGTYGVVYKGTDRTTGEIVAIKNIKCLYAEDGVQPTALREVAVLRSLDHPNVVRLLDVEYDADSMFLVFEYVSEDLKRHIHRTRTTPVDRELVKSFVQQLLRGIDYCHSCGIMHRDLKPANILVDARGQLKMADFGLARAFGLPSGVYTTEVVTLWYRAPEILLGAKRYSLGVDVWSAGCIFAELVRRKPLWDGDSEIDTIFRMFRVLGTPNERTWPGVESLPNFATCFPQWPRQLLAKHAGELESCDGLDLLTVLLTYDPAARVSAKAALRHPYFNVSGAAPASQPPHPAVLQHAGGPVLQHAGGPVLQHAGGPVLQHAGGPVEAAAT